MEERNFQELKKKASYLLESIKEKVGNTDVVLEARNQMMNLLDDIKKLEKEHQDSLSEFTNVLHAHVMEFMTSDLKHMKEEASLKIQAALNEKELHEVRVAFLGKKGRLTGILRMMKNLSDEVRPQMGAMANQIRNEIESMESRKKEELKNKILMEKIESEKIDITLPARHDRRGHIHPLNKALRTIVKSFTRMGYSVEEGPEIESDYYNFYCLNLPKDHPARDMQDSFYITPDILLRTQTSPVQARIMQRNEPNTPIRMIAPGKVFRWDNDATHSPVFHQVEGLVVDKGIKFSALKGTLEVFLKDLFGSDTRIRFRASYFPFTEPSAEVDISFSSRIDEQSDDPNWLEILGCGMVHPNVFELNNYDPNKVSGFAFGMGIERIAMLLYGIDDLRLFYENNMKFLKQF
ncbi:phenylalanine--tRNA ligase subunit alpha [Dialister pneumosintes]|uniref:Phenylalanine--tRNA ligase alpha subunit n=2 Tax=Dialister pneumosintes TaxID=39950 RepID=A0A1B3WDI9_9FIRM|nr:phenylalanine--tRNA ligase subunit alpha [Dialister pneumosintes]